MKPAAKVYRWIANEQRLVTFHEYLCISNIKSIVPDLLHVTAGAHQPVCTRRSPLQKEYTKKSKKGNLLIHNRQVVPPCADTQYHSSLCYTSWRTPNMEMENWTFPTWFGNCFHGEN